MPYPRSASRTHSATPAKNTSPAKRAPRAGSLIPSGSVDSSATLRGSGEHVTNPELPDVQAQQSFAYGSQKTPFLPEKLVAKDKMSLQEMANTIDQGIRQAEARFAAQAAEAEANFGKTAQSEARAERLRRRSESRESSVRSSRQGSSESHNTEVRTTRRTAAWASSVGTGSHLDDVEEEDTQSGRESTPDAADDEYTRKGGETPSSFPSGLFDISYNQERGRFKPSQGTFWPAQTAGEVISRTVILVWSFSKQYLPSPTRDTFDLGSRAENLPWSARAVLLKAITVGSSIVLALILLGALVCQTYTRFLCDYNTSSALHFNMQKFCGGCVASPGAWNNLSQGHNLPPDLSIVLGSLHKQIRQVESRIDTEHAVLSATLDKVLDQQYAIEATVSNLQRKQPDGSTPSPSMKKINYCSAGSGAVIEPYLTSPTKQKKLNYVQRLFMSTVGMQRYESRPPSEALRSWEDVGDCWCAAAGQGFAQLGVLMREMVYPTDIVIEHAPYDTSPTPDTAPKELELWGDFSHLGPGEFVDAGFDKLAHDAVLPKSFARIGKMTYKAGKGHPAVQTFKLDINQDGKTYATQKVVFRATSNYGAHHTCFYRVRLHGAPLVPHPQITVDGKVVSLPFITAALSSGP